MANKPMHPLHSHVYTVLEQHGIHNAILENSNEAAVSLF